MKDELGQEWGRKEPAAPWTPHLPVLWRARWRQFRFLSLIFMFFVSPFPWRSWLTHSINCLEEIKTPKYQGQGDKMDRETLLSGVRVSSCHQPSDRGQLLRGPFHRSLCGNKSQRTPFLGREVTSDPHRQQGVKGTRDQPRSSLSHNSPQRWGPWAAAHSWSQSGLRLSQAARTPGQCLSSQEPRHWQRRLGQPAPGRGYCPGRGRGCRGPSLPGG